MEAPTYCSNPVISNISYTSQGSGGVSTQPAKLREVILVADSTSTFLGQNGRELEFPRPSFRPMIEDIGQFYIDLLQFRGLQ